MRDTATIQTELRAAMAARDPRAFEDALYAAFEANLPSALFELVVESLLLPWHFRHEDVATALRRMGDPRAVDALFQAVTSCHTYLSFDEDLGLARKCIMALAALGTAPAKQRLTELASSENPVVARAAQRRLDAWVPRRVGDSTG